MVGCTKMRGYGRGAFGHVAKGVIAAVRASFIVNGSSASCSVRQIMTPAGPSRPERLWAAQPL